MVLLIMLFKVVQILSLKMKSLSVVVHMKATEQYFNLGLRFFFSLLFLKIKIEGILECFSFHCLRNMWNPGRLRRKHVDSIRKQSALLKVLMITNSNSDDCKKMFFGKTEYFYQRIPNI